MDVRQSAPSDLRGRYRKLAVFDVDGVLFRNIFLMRIAWHTGIRNYFRTLYLGFRYFTNSISFDSLMKQCLRLIGDVESGKARAVAARIRRSRNIAETFTVLHREGYYISLMSAGIPDFILKDLCDEFGADHYTGLNVEIRDGRMRTSSVSIRPKLETVKILLERLSLDWKDVVTIADDPNNIDIIMRSSLGIGFNPSKAIRRYADIVIDGYNMLELLPFTVPEERLPREMRKSSHSARRELYRKTIHFLGVPLPFLAYMNEKVIFLALMGVIFLYSLSEILRYFGFHFPFLSHVTKQAKRLSEIRGFIVGPISLTVGILLTILFFMPGAYIPAVLIVCISDSISGLVGRRFGRHALGLFNRTLEGSAAFYISAVLILLFFMPLQAAVVAAFIPTCLELVSPYDLDNALIPLGTAAALSLLL
jgi:phytol kinase